MFLSPLWSEKTLTLRLGFVGGGVNSAVGYTHYVASRLDGKFDLVSGCFSRDKQVNLESAKAYHVPAKRVYNNVTDMLSAEVGQLDAVCVLTPTPDHVDDVCLALEFGFNVICEKSLATSTAECRKILSAQRDFDKFLGVTFNYAGYPMVREMREIIRSGALGPVQQVHCEMPQESFARSQVNPQLWRKQDYTIPCVSLDLGVHVYHLITYVTGLADIVDCSVRQHRYGRIENVIDTVAVLAELETGVLASLMWGKAAIGYRNGLRLRIFCQAGSVEWTQSDPDQLICSKSCGSINVLDRGSPELSVANRSRYTRFKAGHPAGFIEAFANIYGDFSCAIGGTPARDVLTYFSGEAASDGIAFLESLGH